MESISNLRFLNFGNLFLENPYLNYAVGFMGGYNQPINDQLSFETKGELVFSLYDRLTKTKVKISACLGMHF